MSTNNGAAVRFEKVQKSYDGKNLVVKDLNLDIAAGEFLTMLGPSGSGKTTCLMMLAGFEPATHGEIFLKNEPINNVPPHKRGIGMVFQNYALFPHMTVAENLAFPLQIRKLSKSDREAKVKKALDMVELGEFGNRRPIQLSGGQQQRVAVARALVFDPDLVLMDEPLGALDKQLREQMQYEIKHIHENLGITVVYVTHDQSEALNQCRVTLGDGTEVAAEAVNIGSIGEKTTISLRPERIEFDPTDSMDNLVKGTIKEVIYHGDHLRVVMDVAGNDEFIVKVRNRGDQRVLETGQTHTLGWAASDCKALDYTG